MLRITLTLCKNMWARTCTFSFDDLHVPNHPRQGPSHPCLARSVLDLSGQWLQTLQSCIEPLQEPPLSPACWTSLIKESFCCDLETGALFAPSLYGLWASLLRSSQLFKSMFQAASDVRKVQARVVPQEHLKRSTAVRRSSASPPRPRSTELAAPKAKSPAASQHEQEDLLLRRGIVSAEC